jgi:AraC family transcriptional regulator of adaptative response/methylated-DNA-[protein]-cysteine methyltransferase
MKAKAEEMTQSPIFDTEESRWNAVLERDRRAQGTFYYAVKSTGVYCRPGCSSRLPRRSNVEFFDTCAQAEEAGYRPCKRCAPGSAAPEERIFQAITRACRRLEREESPPALGELAADAGLSPSRFHRLFKKIVGVTPKQFGAAKQAQRFRDHLQSSQSVTEAIYDAGFGSSRRPYEKSGDHLAMSPSTFRRGAEGLVIHYGVASCYLGWVVVASTERGICAIELGSDPEALPSSLRSSFPRARIERAGADFQSVVDQVVAFIEAADRSLELPLDIQGTAFQERVWRALRDIPPAGTASYAEIADQIGRRTAARAVARACAANRLAVAVPCHRVIRSDGSLGGYRWGVERKRALLSREKSRAVEPDR